MIRRFKDTVESQEGLIIGGNLVELSIPLKMQLTNTKTISM